MLSGRRIHSHMYTMRIFGALQHMCLFIHVPFPQQLVFLSSVFLYRSFSHFLRLTGKRESRVAVSGTQVILVGHTTVSLLRISRLTSSSTQRCTWTLCNSRALYSHGVGCLDVCALFTAFTRPLAFVTDTVYRDVFLSAGWLLFAVRCPDLEHKGPLCQPLAFAVESMYRFEGYQEQCILL